jgi:hypothetical protein
MRTSRSIHRVVAMLAAVSVPALGAALDDECLSAEQRNQLFMRQGEAAAIAAIEVGPRLRLLREARNFADQARETWATCEAGRPASAATCDSEQASFHAATEALAAAEAIHREALDDLKVKAADRLKAVRREFPSCRGADR